jgi:hypothetical protein
LLFGAYIHQPRTKIKMAWFLTAPMIAFAILKAFEAIARSENFSNGFVLHRILETRSTEFLAAASFCALLFAARFGARAMLIAAVISLSFIILLYWPAASANSPVEAFWTSNLELPLTPLEQFQTRDLLVASFTLAMVMIGVVSSWSKRGLGLPLSMLALLIPFVYSLGTGSLPFWWGLWTMNLSIGMFSLGGAGLVWFMLHSPQW